MFFRRYYTPILILIVAFAFCTRVWHLHQPSRYIFDEVYHAVTAKLIARDDPRAYEWWNPAPEENTAVDWLHPPLAKYTQAASILLFGENAFGWRFSSAVFGTGVILLTALLTLRLFQSHSLSLLAAFLASLDGLLLTQSRIAMNDIHVTFFVLLTLLAYSAARPLLASHSHASQRYSLIFLALTGISAGLAVATKWSGLYVLALVWFFEVWLAVGGWLQQKQRRFQLKQTATWLAYRALVLGMLPVALYIASYTHMFLQGKSFHCDQHHYQEGKCYYEQFSWPSGTPTPLISWDGYISHFAELHRQIWHYQTNLEATHQYQSQPWQWFFNLRPVWYHVDYTSDHTRVNIYAFGNPILFLLGNLAVVATLSYFLSQAFHRYKKLQKTAASGKTTYTKLGIWIRAKFQMLSHKRNFPLAFTFAAYLVMWLPWALSPRIMFFYHYTPAVPLLAMLVAFWLGKVWRTRAAWWPWKKYTFGQTIASGAVLLTTLAFILWLPNWVGAEIPVWVLENVYWMIPTWQ